MKRSALIICAISVFCFFSVLKAQDTNLVVNGSFENISKPPSGPGEYKKANGISSANNTSIDLFSVQSHSDDFSVPDNYMGSQATVGGSNYIGIVAFYADESGLLKTAPGYQRYTEYIQLELDTSLIAGKPYLISFNVSLAEKSAYAISGLGAYFSSEKLNTKNNTFLEVTPHLIACEIVDKTEWGTVSGTYVATGGERYLTLGCFNVCLDTLKVISEFAFNTRKAYYYIDDVSVSAESTPKEDLTSVLYGNCFMLKDLKFEPNKSTILPESYEELKELAHFLRTYPFLTVFIDGHTDGINTEVDNEHLSVERADEVKRYLIAGGVKEDHLKARGFGSTDPVDSHNSKSTTNERVEITICAIE